MKMNSLIIWIIFTGILCLILFVRAVLDIQVPVFRVIAGSILILAGISLISGSSGVWPLKSNDNEFFFSSGTVDGYHGADKEYQVVFSEIVYDFTGTVIAGSTQNIKINAVFSSVTVYIDPEHPLKIDVDALFAGVKMPGRNTPLLGRGNYRSGSYDPDAPYLEFKANVIFGNIVFMNKP